MSGQKRIRVLIVDDSATVRRMISDAMASDPAIEVVGVAPDPYIARDLIMQLNPDVLTLDIEMPKMDGLTFLKILQQHRPIPVIIVSSLSQAGSRVAMQALELGAVDVLGKPQGSYSIGDLGTQIIMRVKAAAAARRVTPAVAAAMRSSGGGARGWSGGVVASHPRQIIVIGASTGGTEALKEVLVQMPPTAPPIAIVQHIPPYFSKAFAERMNELCDIEVREATEGAFLRPGLALVAPGDFHMTIDYKDRGYAVSLNQKPQVHHCRPAVDVLFRSVSLCNGAKVVAVLLTGMGVDGAMGMQQLKQRGAATITQDEATCVVYGMPRAAVQLGVVDQVLPLNKITHGILSAVQAMSGQAAARPATAGGSSGGGSNLYRGAIS